MKAMQLSFVQQMLQVPHASLEAGAGAVGATGAGAGGAAGAGAGGEEAAGAGPA